MISEIIPHAVYNPEDDTYDLHLKVKMESNFSVRLGGNISTSNSNQIYMGVSYQNLNYYAKEFLLDGQIGKVYNNLQFMTKVNFATTIQIGRASCRESVDLGGRRIIKKKQEQVM